MIPLGSNNGSLLGGVGDFDHNLVMLELAPLIEKPVIPFKKNTEWMKIEDVVGHIKVIWKPYNSNLRKFVPIKFHQNLKEEKRWLLIK